MALDDWLDDDAEQPDDTQRTRRRRLWYAAAITPWIIVVLIVVAIRVGATDQNHAGIRGSEGPTTAGWHDGAPGSDSFGVAPGLGPSTPFGHETMEDPTRAWGDPGAGSPGTSGHAGVYDGVVAIQLQGDWRQHPGAQAAAATAITTAAPWLATSLDIAPAHFATEAVEMLDGRVAVVTTQVVSSAGDVVRFGVAVRIDGPSARTIGEPWLLPELPRDRAPLAASALDEPQFHREAVEALTEAGYQDVQLLDLKRTESWPVFAHVSARTPEGRPVTSPVVLRRHVDRFVLAGTVLPQGAAHAANGWGQ